jgi:hypothetical protein
MLPIIWTELGEEINVYLTIILYFILCNTVIGINKDNWIRFAYLFICQLVSTEFESLD